MVQLHHKSIALSTRKKIASRLVSMGIVAIALCFAGKAKAVDLDGAVVLVQKSTLLGSAGGVIGSYTYDSANDSYYVAIFGKTQGLRKVWRNTSGDTWQPGMYTSSLDSSYPSDMLRFIRSSDVEGGVVNTDFSGTTTMSGILLNPAELTIPQKAPANYNESMGYGPIDANGDIHITYAPGTLAFITDHGREVKAGGVRHYEWTKKFYRWDLRSIGTPTSVQVDYNTGTSGDPNNPNPGGLFGAYGQADWNDVFSVVATEQDLRNAYATYTGSPFPVPESKDNFGRQFAWSSDGQSAYTVDTGSTGGGLYKIAAAGGSTELIYSENWSSAGGNIIAEPTVVATSTHDYGSGLGSGDQIVFDGTSANGNRSGMMYVVDNGTNVSGIQTLLSGNDLRDYLGFSHDPEDERGKRVGVRSITSDSAGNLYFYEGSTNGLHKLDTQGRLSSVLNKAQLYEVNQTNDGNRSNGGGMLRLQTREETGNTWVTYRGDNSYIGGVRIFETGDFNHDDTIDQIDRDFFVTQFNRTFHGNVPDPQNNGDSINDFVDYIGADVNGDGIPVRNGAGELEVPSVTLLDLEVLKQFIPLELGDFNWDGTVLGTEDWNIFNSYLDVAPATEGFDAFSWFDGDVTGDGLVNQLDYQALTLIGDFNFDGSVDGSDLGLWESHFGLTSGAVTGEGDADGDGDVDGADFLSWQRNISPTSTSMTGDFNLDGSVDEIDLDVWENHFGITSGALVGNGDADGDGDVDGSDFLAWQRNYSSGVLSGTGEADNAVPEPTSGLMLIAGGLGLVAQRRRHC